jgi:hypothetical protein
MRTGSFNRIQSPVIGKSDLRDPAFTDVFELNLGGDSSGWKKASLGQKTSNRDGVIPIDRGKERCSGGSGKGPGGGEIRT